MRQTTGTKYFKTGTIDNKMISQNASMIERLKEQFCNLHPKLIFAPETEKENNQGFRINAVQMCTELKNFTRKQDKMFAAAVYLLKVHENSDENKLAEKKIAASYNIVQIGSQTLPTPNTMPHAHVTYARYILQQTKTYNFHIKNLRQRVAQ